MFVLSFGDEYPWMDALTNRMKTVAVEKNKKKSCLRSVRGYEVLKGMQKTAGYRNITRGS